MVIRAANPVRSVNAGEFSPDAEGRIDTKQFYSGAKRMKGVEPVPQSGFRRMGGTWHVMKARKPLVALPITGAALSAGPHTGTQTIWTGTVSGLLSLVNIKGFALSAGAATFWVEAQTGAGWVPVGAVFGDWTTAADRTAGFAPQEGKQATAVRIRATFSVAATVAISSVTAWSESGDPVAPRQAPLTADDGTAYSAFVAPGIADFATEQDGYVGSALLPLTAADMLPALDFYGEADTIGIFHPSAVPSQRIRNFGAGHEWGVDAWPYDPIPDVDLGGTYAQTDDVWEVNIAWSTNTEIFLNLTVDGEETPAIPLIDTGTGDPVLADSADATDWAAFAVSVKAALEALASFGPTITVVYDYVSTKVRRLTVTFGGAQTGTEYQFSSAIFNTVNASANSVHLTIGTTEGEPLFSASRGYPGIIEEVQNRTCYARIPAKTGALALSKIAEPFDLNIEGQNDATARLDNIRSKTTEEILAVKESKYLLIFTTRGVYFANNRTIEKGQPLNFVKASETGIRANTKPVDLDGLVYYISSNGEQMRSLAYDDVSTSYTDNPESLLSAHLISGVLRTVRQASEKDQDAAKNWILREDGRLIAGQVIRNQEITGFCEWLVSQGGQVKEAGVDGNNRLWLTILRNGQMTHELYDRETLFQGTIRKTCDLAGNVTGITGLSGEVWARAQGYVLGPFTVTTGSIALGDWFDGDVEIGSWIPLVFESMRQPFVTGNDEIVFRPGRIHTAHINLIDTTSIAIGANGGTFEDFPLTEAHDPVNEAMAPKTKLISKYGMLGNAVGPTLVITQIRPGELRVRDLALETKL